MPLLIALDQEGGSVQTLKGPDFPLIPSAQRLGAGPAASLRAAVRDSARRLNGIGVTVNLAPVADTVPARLGEGNPPIGAFHRQYGSDPARVAADIEQVVAASQGAGVLTILKHFPGLGRVTANTDTSTRAVDSTATANDPYLEPFVAGIKAGSAGVMVSSASYPKLDAKNIAAFSRADHHRPAAGEARLHRPGDVRRPGRRGRRRAGAVRSAGGAFRRGRGRPGAHHPPGGRRADDQGDDRRGGPVPGVRRPRHRRRPARGPGQVPRRPARTARPSRHGAGKRAPKHR